MLAMHENVQHRLAEEINEVFGEYKDLIIDYEKLSELKYVEMVIKETLRLFSPATGKRSFSFRPTLAGYCNLFEGIFREVKADVDLGSVGMGEARLRPFFLALTSDFRRRPSHSNLRPDNCVLIICRHRESRAAAGHQPHYQRTPIAS